MAGNFQNRVIETENLTIRGHLLKWSDTTIQISNISMVSTANLPLPRFPIWTIIALIVGLPLVAQLSGYSSYYYYDAPTLAILVAGCLLIGAGAVGFIVWLFAVKESFNQKYLHLFLNSGNIYSFVVRDQNFLKQILQVFSNIFESGTTNQTNFSINVTDSTIRENGAIIQVFER